MSHSRPRRCMKAIGADPIVEESLSSPASGSKQNPTKIDSDMENEQTSVLRESKHDETTLDEKTTTKEPNSKPCCKKTKSKKAARSAWASAVSFSDSDASPKAGENDKGPLPITSSNNSPVVPRHPATVLSTTTHKSESEDFEVVWEPDCKVTRTLKPVARTTPARKRGRGNQQAAGGVKTKTRGNRVGSEKNEVGTTDDEDLMPKTDAEKDVQNPGNQSKASADKQKELNRLIKEAGVDSEEMEMSFAEKEEFVRVLRESTLDETRTAEETTKIKSTKKEPSLKPHCTSKKDAKNLWPSTTSYSDSSDTSSKESDNEDGENDNFELAREPEFKVKRTIKPLARTIRGRGSGRGDPQACDVLETRGKRGVGARNKVGAEDDSELIPKKRLRTLKATKRAPPSSFRDQNPKKTCRMPTKKSTQVVLSNVMPVSSDDSDMSDTVIGTPQKKSGRARQSVMEVEVKVHVKISPTNSQGNAGDASTTEEEIADLRESSARNPDAVVQSAESQTQSSPNLLFTNRQSLTSAVKCATSPGRASPGEKLCVPTVDDDVQSSPDLFQTQPFLQLLGATANAVDEKSRTQETLMRDNEGIEGGNCIVPDPAPGPESHTATDSYPFDVYYETAKQKKSEGAKDAALLMDSKHDKGSQDVSTCPFCSGTTYPPYRALINKTKLRNKLLDPAPYFPSHGSTSANCVKLITGYFLQYRRRLREQQIKCPTKMPWPEPVLPGRNCAKTLFVKVRGQAERQRAFDINDSAAPDPHYGGFAEVNDNDQGLPDLDPVKSSVSGLRRSNRNGVPGWSEEADNEETNFVVTLRQTGKNNGKGKKSSTAKQTEAATSSAYFTNKNNQPLRKGDKKEQSVPGTPHFDVILADELSDDGIPAAQRNDAKSDVGNATLLDEDESKKVARRMNLKNAKVMHSEPKSPSPFKLTTHGTMEYEDDEVAEDNVESISKGKATATATLASSQHKPSTPMKDGTSSENCLLSDEKESDDIVMFESPKEKRKPVTSPVRSTSRKKLKFQISKKTAKVDHIDDDKTVKVFRNFRAGSESPEFIEDVDGSGEKAEDLQPEERADEHISRGTSLSNTRLSRSKMGGNQGGDNAEAGKITEKVKQQTDKPYRKVVAVPLVNPKSKRTGASTAVRPATRVGRVPTPPLVEEEEEEEMVECPICSVRCPISVIERHASACEGPSTLEAHRGPIAVVGESDSEEESDVLIGRKRTGRSGPPISTKSQSEDVPVGECPICCNSVPIMTLEVHVDECLTRLEQADIPAAEPARQTRANAASRSNAEPEDHTTVRRNAVALGGATARRPLHMTKPGPIRRRLSVSKTQTPVITLLHSDDEDIPPTVDVANLARKPLSQARLSQMEDVLEVEGSQKRVGKTPQRKVAKLASTKSPIPASPKSTSSLMSMVPRLSDPTSPLSQTIAPSRIGPKARRGRAARGSASDRRSSRGAASCGMVSNKQPEAAHDYSSHASSSDTSASDDDSLSDAEDDVPIGTTLIMPPTLGTTRQSQERAISPISTFCSISSMQGNSQIDFQNQFRRERPEAVRGGAVKRKRRSTGRKKKRRKARKTAVSTRGRKVKVKSEPVVQHMKIKEEC